MKKILDFCYFSKLLGKDRLDKDRDSLKSHLTAMMTRLREIREKLLAGHPDREVRKAWSYRKINRKYFRCENGGHRARSPLDGAVSVDQYNFCVSFCVAILS